MSRVVKRKKRKRLSYEQARAIAESRAPWAPTLDCPPSILARAIVLRKERNAAIQKVLDRLGHPIRVLTKMTEAQKRADRIAEANELCWLRGPALPLKAGG